MLERYILKDGRRLRCGYTTGSCAAAATAAATRMLLTGSAVDMVTLDTPSGVRLALDVLDIRFDSEQARCAVRKDSGDDPDITNGTLVYSTVEKTDVGLFIDGGEGVGRVTRPGLDQPVGAAAINAVPRRMIREQALLACRESGYTGGLRITISIPGGEALAKKTFNPRLGIEGGLSVIGTTGIVEPMSSAALLDTIRLELSVLKADGAKAALLCPGNYGRDFARDVLRLNTDRIVSVGNFIGDGIGVASDCGFERILLVGHVGKLVKLGIGMTNTHSRYGDGRMETLAACAVECDADTEVLKALLACATTDAALDVLEAAGLLEQTMRTLGRRIHATLLRCVPEGAQLGFVCFTNAGGRGVLTQSENALALMREWR